MPFSINRVRPTGFERRRRKERAPPLESRKIFERRKFDVAETPPVERFAPRSSGFVRRSRFPLFPRLGVKRRKSRRVCRRFAGRDVLIGRSGAGRRRVRIGAIAAVSRFRLICVKRLF
jgi:hypothetical protein